MLSTPMSAYQSGLITRGISPVKESLDENLEEGEPEDQPIQIQSAKPYSSL